MKTSKGTIQEYNGIATVDSKHQIIIDAQAVGEGQEQHTLIPVLERIQERYTRLGISEAIYFDGLIVTADTGYTNQTNLTYLRNHSIDGYVPGNQFRQRDPAFADQKEKHGKKKPNIKKVQPFYTADDFHLDVKRQHCLCPAGQSLTLKRNNKDDYGNQKLFFQGKLSQCRGCNIECAIHAPSRVSQSSTWPRSPSLIHNHAQNTKVCACGMDEATGGQCSGKTDTRRTACRC